MRGTRFGPCISLRVTLLSGLALAGVWGCRDFGFAPSPVQSSAPGASTNTPQEPIGSQIEQLVAPIALYPDPLLAIVLPASTYRQQLLEAATLLETNRSLAPDLIDAQRWDPSVKALIRYPDALQTLDNDPLWMGSLGAAFNDDPGEVSDAIQELRARAVAANNLQTNAQVTVIQENNAIAILPSNPEVIYVPRYDPVTVYFARSPIFYLSHYPAGSWLVNGYDWIRGAVVVGCGPYDWRNGRWSHDQDWEDKCTYWHRDSRWGPPPFYRGHYFAPGSLNGRESRFDYAMGRANPYRGAGRSVQQIRDYQRHRARYRPKDTYVQRAPGPIHDLPAPASGHHHSDQSVPDPISIPKGGK